MIDNWHYPGVLIAPQTSLVGASQDMGKPLLSLVFLSSPWLAEDLSEALCSCFAQSLAAGWIDKMLAKKSSKLQDARRHWRQRSRR